MKAARKLWTCFLSPPSSLLSFFSFLFLSFFSLRWCLQVQRRDHADNTLLHLVIAQRLALAQRVWEMNPDALFIVNKLGFTPFHYALSARNDCSFEHFQWKLSMEQIEEAFDKMSTNRQLHEGRFQEVVRGECELLLLPRDCVNVVYEYLVKEKKKGPSLKRAKRAEDGRYSARLLRLRLDKYL